MVIGAYAIGAAHGFVYVRAEYPIAVEHVGLALAQAHEAASWAGTSSAADSTSTSSCGWGPALSSAAKRAR